MSISILAYWGSGCRKTVGGEDFLKVYMQKLAEVGITCDFEKRVQKVRFGNQGVLTSEKLWHLPVQINGKTGILLVQEVPGKCPLLISEETMRKLRVRLDFD